ncbi:MAG TPA: serine hydrolase domain-containing protein, partial [Candidatus Lustribacter sp.]
MSGAAIDRVLDAACGRAFTAAVARVERRGVVVYERAVGVTRADPDAVPVYVDSQFDLASLTKLFVSTVALDAVARGEVTLDEPLSQWIRPWQSGDRA